VLQDGMQDVWLVEHHDLQGQAGGTCFGKSCMLHQTCCVEACSDMSCRCLLLYPPRMWPYNTELPAAVLVPLQKGKTT
jgi:hypothetical protein